MTRQIAMMVAAALTAFMVVIMIGVGLTVVIKLVVTANVESPASPVSAPVSGQLAVPASNGIAPKFSADQATRIAAGLAPNAKLTRAPELVDLQGTLAYEVVLNQGTMYIDANTGKVLLNGVSTPSTAPVTVRSRETNEKENHEGGRND